MKKKTAQFFAFVLILAAIVPFQTFAQSGGLVPCGTNAGNPCTFLHFFTLIQNIINFLLKIVAVPLAVVGIAYAGFNMVLYGGNPSKRADAEKVLWDVVIGIALAFGAWVIVNFIVSLVGNEAFSWSYFLGS